jgi:hypothetical protein
MLFRRNLAPTLLALSVITIGGGSTLTAQLSTGSGSLAVPITGVADLGGTFRGTMLIDQFAPQANGVAAVGTVTGALTANGTARNIVVPVTLPLDIAASRARLSTDPALAQASCDVLHVELSTASINVLGFTIGLTPAAFDIASALQGGTTTTPTSASTAAQPAVTAAQPGTVTASPSTNTTQPATTAAQQASAQTQLGSLLCSVDGFRNVSNVTQLAQQLNAILTALGTTQGS